MHSQKGNILVVWLVVAALLWLIAITLGIGGPQSQVISQQLHDECWVFVWVLIECVQLGYRVIERLSGKQNTYIFISICNREIKIIYIDILTMQNAGKVNANASSNSSSHVLFCFERIITKAFQFALEVHSLRSEYHK